jgi:type IV pilus assembly protein PilO
MTTKKKQTVILTAAAVLILAALLLIFFTVVQPRMTAQETVETNLAEEEERIALLEEETAEAAAEAAEEEETSTERQERLPVIRQTDQFLLDIGMAEEIAGVRIRDIQMEYDQPVYTYEVVNVTSGEPMASEDEAETGVEVETPEAENEDPAEDPVDTEAAEPAEEREIDPLDMPAGALQDEPISGVQKQTAIVELHTNSYESLSAFLFELDSLTREVNVDSVLFLREDEEAENIEESRIFEGQTNIVYEVHVSSFYYPELDHLEHEAPLVDYPDEEDRQNPFGN